MTLTPQDLWWIAIVVFVMLQLDNVMTVLGMLMNRLARDLRQRAAWERRR